MIANHLPHKLDDATQYGIDHNRSSTEPDITMLESTSPEGDCAFPL
jgi:hypothetical protein